MIGMDNYEVFVRAFKQKFDKMDVAERKAYLDKMGLKYRKAAVKTAIKPTRVSSNASVDSCSVKVVGANRAYQCSPVTASALKVALSEEQIFQIKHQAKRRKKQMIGKSMAAAKVKR